MSVSDKIDSIVTNRWLALPIFILVMALVYAISMGGWSISIGTMGTDWANDVLFGEWVPGAVDAFLQTMGVGGWLASLIQDGMVAGVGAVLGFVPQMLVLFFLLCILEDIGYMARIAFIMDRIFRRFGPSGKSFIPMLVATGCGVPGSWLRGRSNRIAIGNDDHDDRIHFRGAKNADHRSVCRGAVQQFRLGCDISVFHRRGRGDCKRNLSLKKFKMFCG